MANYEELSCEELKKLCKKYERQLKRVDKIVKQSDKQQMEILRLYEKIDELYNYNITQEKIAMRKIESIITNQLEDQSEVIYKPSDILSGDFYSLFKLQDGRLLYILDGQGHGVSPALTIYALGSNMLQILADEYISFSDIVARLFKEARKFLLDDEQLSYTLVYISDDGKTLKYAGGGMFPFYVKTEDGIVEKFRANNLPFMSFSKIPSIETIELDEKIKDLVMYSDGLIEEPDVEEIRMYHPSVLIQKPELMKGLKELVQKHKFNDDITVIYYNHSK